MNESRRPAKPGGRKAKKSHSWRLIHLLTPSVNWAILELLSDGKARRAIDIADKLKGTCSRAGVYKVLMTLAEAGIITPAHTKTRKGFGYSIGYTISPKMKRSIALIVKADREAELFHGRPVAV